MPILYGLDARVAVPRPPVRPRPLHDVEMPPAYGRPYTGTSVPWTAVLSCPLENCEVPFTRGRQAGVLVPGASVCPRPG